VQAIQIQPAGAGAVNTYREINVDNIGVYKNTPTPVPPQANLFHVKAFPQPCKMANHECQGFTFTGLTAHTDLKVYNMNGELVYSVNISTPTGQYFWDIAAIRRSDAIAPGLYVYTIINEKKQIAKGRLTIIR
jgi:hypothetical protein